MQWDRKAVTVQAHELREKGELTFSTREELITSAANILALDYLENLEFWRCAAMNDAEEKDYWYHKIVWEVIPYRDALKSNIDEESKKKLLGMPKKKIRVSFKHRKLIDLSLISIEKRVGMSVGIGTNVIYIINLHDNKLLKIIS